MKKNMAYRYRIYPSREQQELFARTFGCCRFLYNAMLADKIAEYEDTGKRLRTLPSAYKKEYPWLKEVDSLALANVQLNLERAYKNFFERPESGFPVYKSKHRSRASYTTNMVNGNIRLEEGFLRLPKAGSIKIRLHREIPQGHKIKSVTISREPSGKYYASILTEYEAEENQTVSQPKELCVLGIDYAQSGMGVFSDGTRAEYPGYYRKASERLAREQRKLSRCEKGSRNREKQRKRVARCHERIRNQRRDYHHKLSLKLAEGYDVVAVEDLNLKGMSRGLDLGKGISDNGYGSFLTILEYKLKERGKRLVRVGRFYPSSKRCSCCGRIKKELALSERVYSCECGARLDRDLNAAINIKNEAERMLAS